MIEIRNFKPDDFKRVAYAKLGQRIEAACILLQNEIKKVISEPSPPPSIPGEPPHKLTGSLRNSISRDVDKEKGVGRVGTNKKVGLWMELGTRFIAPRPYLRPTYYKFLTTIKRIIGG